MKAWFEKGELIVSACHMSFDIVDCNNKIDTEPADKRPVEKHSKNWKQLNGINESVKKSDSHSKIVSVFRVNKEDIKALRDSELNDEDSSLHNEIDERTGFFSNFDSCSEFCGFLNRFNAEGGSITEDDYRNLNEDWSKLKFFNGCYKIDQDKLQTLKSIVKQVGNDINLNWIDTSEITDMSGLFSGLYYFNGDISQWDVSNVTSMEGMFKGCAEFNCDISKWKVFKVTNMNEMFSGCMSFNHNLRDWKIGEKAFTKNMFRLCGLCDENIKESIELSTDIPTVQNKRRRDIDDMLYEINFSEDQEEDDIEYVNRTKMYFDIFYFAKYFRSCSLNEKIEWKGRLFTTEQIHEKFIKNELQSDELGLIKANPEVEDFFLHFEKYKQLGNFLNRVDKGGMFTEEDYKNLNGDWNKLRLFIGCYTIYKYTTPDFKSFLKSFIQQIGSDVNLNWISTYHITDMSNLFSGLYYFNGDISQWDVSNVTNMEGMFEGCVEFDGDLSGWAINENTRTVNMFRLCGIDDDNKPKMK